MKGLLSYVDKNRLIAIVLVFLTPCLFLGFFSYPSADDYPYSLITLAKGFLGTQEYYYNEWSGRYVATALMSLSPVVFRSFLGYKLVGIITYLIFLGTCWAFVRALLGPRFDSRLTRVIYVFFLVLYVCEMPSITEAFNWYPGVVNYTLSLVIFLLGIAYYFSSTGLSLSMTAAPDWEKNKIRDIFVLSVLSFLMPGVNESLVVVWLYFISVLILVRFLIYRKFPFALLVPIVVGLIGFYIVYRAPGNLVRGALFPNNHNFLFTIFRPSGLIVELFFRYTKPSIILFFIAAFPFLSGLKEKIHPNIFSKNARILTVLFYLSTCFLFLAPAHWAMGGAPARRAMNLYCYMHLVFLILIYCQYLWSQPLKSQKIYDAIIKKYPVKLHSAVFILSLFVVSNFGVAWADLLYRAPIYASEQAQRIATLEAPESLGKDIVVPALSFHPETVFFAEISENPSEGDNRAMADYFGVKSISVRPKGVAPLN